MTLIVFLRGMNVGGHRKFRPSILTKELRKYDVVNVGAAGTFVVRKPGSKAKFRAELRRKLPFETQVVLCDGRDLLRLVKDDPFKAHRSSSDAVPFLSVLSKPNRSSALLPIKIPQDGEWFVQIIAVKGRFVCGVYRRHMKTIGYLGKIDKLFSATATTRTWKTIIAISEILKEQPGING
jgi:uncharacterized protein (DUF1697 family)